MTKERAPVSIENTLYKVLGRIGIERAAEVTDRSTSYLRALSDPEKRERLTVEDAIALDLEHEATGGTGHPLIETYQLLLGDARRARFCGEAAILRQTVEVLREGGEAHQALAAAALPGATSADRRNARREVEENIAALTAALPLLTEPTVPDTS